MGTILVVLLDRFLQFEDSEFPSLTVLDADSLGTENVSNFYTEISQNRDLARPIILALRLRIWSLSRTPIPFVDAVIVRPSEDTWEAWSQALFPLAEKEAFFHHILKKGVTNPYFLEKGLVSPLERDDIWARNLMGD